MNQVAWEEAGATIVPLTDCEFDDIFPIIQWMVRILCFGAGYLLLNAWRKESKEDFCNELGLIQELFKPLSFCLSRILQWLQSSLRRRHNTSKDKEQRAAWAPMDYSMQSDLESLLNHLSSSAKSCAPFPKEPSLMHLKEEIHANLLAQRALRGAIQMKSESVAQEVYGILTRKEIAIGHGTFELMVQATACSGNVAAAREFLTRMEALGHKASQTLVLLVENVKQNQLQNQLSQLQNQLKKEMSLKTHETTEEGSVEEGIARRTSQAAETKELEVDSPHEQATYLIPDPAEVPGTLLGFGAEVLHQSLADHLDRIPSEAIPVLPSPSEPRFQSFYFQGLGNVEPGNHHFSGQITVVDFLHPTEDFDGQDWFRAKLVDRQPIGWDIEWRPDYEQGSDNPIALMQFASENSCILLRLHRIQGWLPSIVRQILCSREVPKISYAYDEADRQKTLNSFGFQPQHIVDIMQLSRKRGLVFRGLRGLAEHFQLRMKKDARITCMDWACSGDLTKEQVCYAAEDAYFAFLIHKRLEGDTKSQITEKQYAVNQATQQIADCMRHINMASQQPRVESIIRSMSHHNQVSMMPVYLDVSLSFPYQYQYQIQPEVPYISFMGNCTSEADDPWQNSGHTSADQDPQRKVILNQSEPTKASNCNVRTVATTTEEEQLLERLLQPLPTKHGQKTDPLEAQEPQKATTTNSLMQPKPWKNSMTNTLMQPKPSKNDEVKGGKQGGTPCLQANKQTLQSLPLALRRKSMYYPAQHMYYPTAQRRCWKRKWAAQHT